jgi:hypothetical protein
VQRRIKAINAISAYCGAEEGRSYGRQAGSFEEVTQILAQLDSEATALRVAINSVMRDSRPLICFLCVGNPFLPMRDRVKKYGTVGSLSRHFLSHVTKLKAGKQIDCRICDVSGMHRTLLLNHAERFHGTVTRAGHSQ